MVRLRRSPRVARPHGLLRPPSKERKGGLAVILVVTLTMLWVASNAFSTQFNEPNKVSSMWSASSEVGLLTHPETGQIETPHIVDPKPFPVFATTNTTRPEQALQCNSIQTKICQSQRSFTLEMIALPHTASSTTTRFFGDAVDSWKNAETICGPLATPVWSTCQTDDSVPPSQKQADCVLPHISRFHKHHQSIQARMRRMPPQLRQSIAFFTTLRDPAQLMISHYRERKIWDKQWMMEYPSGGMDSLLNSTLEEWIDKAWWRHNSFVKAYATSAELIWASEQTEHALPSKQDSEEQNAKGKDSSWLKAAYYQLQRMPFFGIHHRMTESFELFQFHTCQFAKTSRGTAKYRTVEPQVQSVMDQHFQLDQLLYDWGVQLFEQRLQEMQELKAKGWQCDLSRTLKMNPKVVSNATQWKPYGLQCVTKPDPGN